MSILQIYNQTDLDNAIRNGTIAFDVYIHGGEAISLKGIKRVVGYLGFANVSCIDLCDIEEIDGDLWVSTSNSVPDSVDLSIVRRVGGSFNLSSTPLDSLCELEYVGGNVDLRNTDIDSLGRLSFVGGNLYLSKRLKDSIDLSNIVIKGKVKYYNQSEAKPTQAQKGLVPSEKPIPAVNKRNGYGFIPDYVWSLDQATKEQVEFYHYFEKCFYDGFLLDVKGFFEYPRFLLQSMLEDTSKPMSSWISDYNRLLKGYPELGGVAEQFYRKRGQYDMAWEFYKTNKYISLSDIGFFEEKLNKKLFDARLLIGIPGASELSPWGKQHLEDILLHIQLLMEGFEKKWDRRFLQVFVDTTLNPQKDYGFYKQFYITEEFFNEVNSWEYGKFYPENYEKDLPNIASQAIIQQCKTITVEAEDSYRKAIGMPLIGEFWRSETELYYSIKEAFKDLEVKQHASPRWLGRQHLDVYIPKYNIGLEYQGAQHYRPIDYFGGEEAFIRGQERDAKKKRLCEENGCVLIYVEEGYDLGALVEQIKQTIARLSIENDG